LHRHATDLAGKEDQLWYFRELVGAFRDAGAAVRMVEEFSQVVSELERLAMTARRHRSQKWPETWVTVTGVV
jgi:hypothetical protein